MYKITKYKIWKLIIDIYKNWSHYSLNSLKNTTFKFDNRTLYSYWKWLIVFFEKKNKYWKSRKLIYISTKVIEKINKIWHPTLLFINSVDCYDLFYEYLKKNAN